MAPTPRSLPFPPLPIPIFNPIYIIIQAVIVFGLGFLALRAVLLYQREEDFQRPLVQMVDIVVALLATNFVAGWVMG